MVKAELNYNPYLLETYIKFNGQAPRINSLVEKYQDEILQTWVDKIPLIFCDEMNGYGFELNFSGTISDYEDVKKAFHKSGVSDKEVIIFHKNELDSRYQKLLEIDAFFQWFQQNPNRKFDFESFQRKYAELFNNYYTCIVIGDTIVDEIVFENVKISVETIEDIHELDKTQVINTPILFWLNNKTINYIKINLAYLLEIKKVKQNQLFFMIHSSLNYTDVERKIKDLGVKSPQIIEKLEDNIIKKYFEVYPISEYIYKTIHVLKTEETILSEKLKTENNLSKIYNQGIYGQIDFLEEQIKNLKKTLGYFINKDNLDIPEEMLRVKETFCLAISNWKNRKTKLITKVDAENYAEEFDSDMNNLYYEFRKNLWEIAKQEREKIEKEFKTWYEQGNYDMEYIPNMISINPVEVQQVMIKEELLQLKEEQYVQPKEEFWGKWRKSTEEKKSEPVLEITYYLQKWREKALELIEPTMEDAIQKYHDILKYFAAELDNTYQSHLNDLIQKCTEQKEEVSAQLSEEAFKLQKDNDWLAKFQDQLKVIERG